MRSRRDDAQLADLGVDSLMSMELLREIENAFKITVPADDRVEVVDLPSLTPVSRRLSVV